MKGKLLQAWGAAVWLPHLEQAGSVLGTQRHSVPREARSGGGVFAMRVDSWLQVWERARQIGFLKGHAGCCVGEVAIRP